MRFVLARRTRLLYMSGQDGLARWGNLRVAMERQTLVRRPDALTREAKEIS